MKYPLTQSIRGTTPLQTIDLNTPNTAVMVSVTLRKKILTTQEKTILTIWTGAETTQSIDTKICKAQIDGTITRTFASALSSQ